MTDDQMKYRPVMWAEQQPNIYAGPQCNEVNPQWYCECDGDMGGEVMGDLLELSAKTFPAGTKIQVMIPQCPLCGLTADACIESGECSFDWAGWATNKYQ